MRNPSSNTTDGMFVRRRNPQFTRRPSIDGMRRQVPSKFLDKPQTEQGLQPSSDSHDVNDVPPVQQNGDASDRVADQLQYNSQTADVQPPVKPIDIDMSLDDNNNKGNNSDKGRRGGWAHHFWPPHRPSKRTVLITLALILALGGYFGWRAFDAASRIFKGNLLTALLSPDKPLKTDQNGNTNVLLLGTSESDPNHPGAQLTDSMMVASMNQKTHQVFLMSIPRDLWVTYDHSCSAGYAGKINAAYECALGSNQGGLSSTQNDETAAENAAATKVSEVTGAQIQYVVHMNLAVVQKVVDAVGGIDITIESPDPRGILDRNFDWRCNYKCYLVKYPNGPVHLNGTQAMWLVQARNDAGGYGLPRSNFDREVNQRKVVTATKDKATSVGFLANPVNVLNLLDAMGSNIHTTIDSSEIKSFINAVKAVPSNNITSVDILNDGQNILTTGTGPDGSSIVKPVAGLTDFSKLQTFVGQLLGGRAPIIVEHSTVDVLNGSGASGAATTEADKLKNDGLMIGNVASASTTKGTYQLYDLSGGKKPNTLKKLEQDLGLNAATGTSLPTGIKSTSSFVVIIGQDANTSTSSTTSQQ